MVGTLVQPAMSEVLRCRKHYHLELNHFRLPAEMPCLNLRALLQKYNEKKSVLLLIISTEQHSRHALQSPAWQVPSPELHLLEIRGMKSVLHSKAG